MPCRTCSPTVHGWRPPRRSAEHGLGPSAGSGARWCGDRRGDAVTPSATGRVAEVLVVARLALGLEMVDLTDHLVTHLVEGLVDVLRRRRGHQRVQTVDLHVEREVLAA